MRSVLSGKTVRKVRRTKRPPERVSKSNIFIRGIRHVVAYIRDPHNVVGGCQTYTVAGRAIDGAKDRTTAARPFAGDAVSPSSGISRMAAV